jgi:hypothetical protein
MGGFVRDAPKAENGFVIVRIVSSRPGGRNIQQKISIISGASRRRSKRARKFQSGSRSAATQAIRAATPGSPGASTWATAFTKTERQPHCRH